ncbi:MAG: hypothetical protein JST75_20910 [Bacteroidetes bacterium]|nr:hypothetical protein [Bacteroidota bacterium]
MPKKKMEVHAHDLHKMPGHGWKHYLFEFFMLFLAVTLGFYAENLREGIKNKEEINLNMRSLLSDLKGDIAHFDSVLDRNAYGYMLADSLIRLLHSDLSNTTEIYFCARGVTSNIGYFYANSKTFEQMKTSGLLKLIRPRSLLDSIGAYYVSFQWLANQNDLLRFKLDEIHKGNAELFDSYVFYQMMNVNLGSFNGTHLVINKPEGHPALLSTEFKKINAVSMNYHYYSTTAKFYCRTAMIQRKIALRLIELINKEYEME